MAVLGMSDKLLPDIATEEQIKHESVLEDAMIIVTFRQACMTPAGPSC
jgi:AMMECR1 domain-containing protein